MDHRIIDTLRCCRVSVMRSRRGGMRSGSESRMHSWNVVLWRRERLRRQQRRDPTTVRLVTDKKHSLCCVQGGLKKKPRESSLNHIKNRQPG